MRNLAELCNNEQVVRQPQSGSENSQITAVQVHNYIACHNTFCFSASNFFSSFEISLSLDKLSSDRRSRLQRK